MQHTVQDKTRMQYTSHQAAMRKTINRLQEHTVQDTIQYSMLNTQYSTQNIHHTQHTTQTHRTQHTQCTTKNAMHNSCNMQYKTRHSAAALQKQLQDSPIHCVATHSFTLQQQHIREYE